jgi:hypothetical protein
MNSSRLRLSASGLLLCMVALGCRVAVPTPPPPPAAAAAKIASAKTVFVSNLGSDPVAAANIPGGANASYNQFYASLQQWGHFELATSPSNADLIFEIRSTEKRHESEHVGRGEGPRSYAVATYPSITSLTIRNPADQSVLWTTETKFLVAATPKGVYSHFDQAIENLTNQLKELVPSGVPAAVPPK